MSHGLKLALFFSLLAIAAAGAATFWFGGIKKEPMVFLLVPIRSHVTCIMLGMGDMIAALALAIVVGLIA